MGTKETEYAPGVSSSMRKALKFSRYLGGLMIGYSVSLTSFMAYVDGRYELIPVVLTLLGTGAGMITGVSVAKAWQSQAEISTTGQ